MANGADGPQRAKPVTVAGKGLLTPLSIIALFLTLTETVLGIAVTQTSGSVQIALTCFVISFPVFVAAAFFKILSKKPWHFYAPSDYAGLDPRRFVDALRGEVDQKVAALFAADPNAGKAPTVPQFEDAKRIEQFVRPFDLSVVQQQVLDLARDYEHTRAFVPVGDERTHRMEVIITKMRMLALAALRLLAELTRSPSLGARLAAIAFLQVQPSPEYLQWLAERLAEDPGAFHGYHAAVALRSAAHFLGTFHREEVQRAIETARRTAREDSKGADAFKVVDDAERVLHASSR